MNDRKKYIALRNVVSNELPSAIDDSSGACAHNILERLWENNQLSKEIRRGFLMEVHVENLLACTGLSDENIAREVLDYLDHLIIFNVEDMD